MDAFFAAVEVLDAPVLAGRPVAVGGDGPRGVVASCTYEARAQGVRSAMPMMEARRRCPAMVVVAPRPERYREVSTALHAVLGRVTPLVEPVGLDEAFLDVSGARRRLGPPPIIARALRQQVASELRLTCAAGVARTKSLAKLASRRAKAVPPGRRRPDEGLVVVAPEDEASFLRPLAVTELWGVGPATTARLAGAGIATVGDLATVPAEALGRLVGAAAGAHLADLARGLDTDPVLPDRPVKSLGHEVTLPVDVRDGAVLAARLAALAGAVGDRLGRHGLAARTVTLKVRFADRRTITRSVTVSVAVEGPHRVLAAARRLLAQVDVSGGVRLVGVSVGDLVPRGGPVEQLTLVEVPAPADDAAAALCRDPATGVAAGRWRQVDGALVAVRRRFGASAVVPAAAVQAPGR